MQPSYIIADKRHSVVKKNRNGLLCIFDTEIEAKLYLERFGPTAQAECVIEKRYFEFTKTDMSLVDLIKEAVDYLDTNSLTTIAHGSILHVKFESAIEHTTKE